MLDCERRYQHALRAVERMRRGRARGDSAELPSDARTPPLDIEPGRPIALPATVLVDPVAVKKRNEPKSSSARSAQAQPNTALAAAPALARNEPKPAQAPSAEFLQNEPNTAAAAAPAFERNEPNPTPTAVIQNEPNAAIAVPARVLNEANRILRRAARKRLFAPPLPLPSGPTYTRPQNEPEDTTPTRWYGTLVLKFIRASDRRRGAQARPALH